MSLSDGITFPSASTGNTIQTNYSNISYGKINKTPILCKVRHTIAAVDRTIMPVNHIIRISFITVCFLFSIIGSIIACLTSHRVSPYSPVAPDEPVNGAWNTWSSWSKCSISCSKEDQIYGEMSRKRFCNSPPPQLGGNNCTGKSIEIESCFKSSCPIPIHGNWTEWSEWTVCSKTCQDLNDAPLQFRKRQCTNPSPKNDGKQCEGDAYNQRFCEWLPQCPIDGKWGEWYIAGPCESRDQKSCALGSQRYQRQCNKPSPNADGKPCEGNKEKIEDCWFFIGCPVTLQPPLNLHVTGNGTGLFNVSWSSVPYGKTASIYRIYKTIEDDSNKEISTVHEDHNALPNQKITSKEYSTIIDLRTFLFLNNFKTLNVRMSSIDYWKEESLLTKPIRSLVRAVDGKWAQWSHWLECSTKCQNQPGYRTRSRECKQPPPSNGGKDCIGKNEEKVSCFGMEDNC